MDAFLVAVTLHTFLITIAMFTAVSAIVPFLNRVLKNRTDVIASLPSRSGGDQRERSPGLAPANATLAKYGPGRGNLVLRVRKIRLLRPPRLGWAGVAPLPRPRPAPVPNSEGVRESRGGARNDKSRFFQHPVKEELQSSDRLARSKAFSRIFAAY
jgi:hypothetical protein